MIADQWPASNGAVATMLKENADTVRGLVTASLVALGAFTADMLKFVLSIIVAGVLLANAKAGGKVAENFLDRVMGPRGPAMVDLAAGTIRNVAKGILGVAVIQTVMFSLGVFIAGVPAAGLLSVVALLLCIVQMDTTTAVILTIWLVITMVSDNILKPLLLGRGAAVPTAVIFLGAIGGFILSGFIGLFTGAVVLSIGYKLMNAWMGGAEKQLEEAP
jgi:predicted PurR-regulated permease PerM